MTLHTNPNAPPKALWRAEFAVGFIGTLFSAYAFALAYGVV